MSYEVLLLGLLVGVANFASAICRCACVWVMPAQPNVRGRYFARHHWHRLDMRSAGCSTAPEVMHDTRRFVPTLVGSRYWVPVSIKHAALSSQHCLCAGLWARLESDGDYITHKNHFLKQYIYFICHCRYYIG